MKKEAPCVEKKCFNCYYVSMDNMYEPEKEFLCFRKFLKKLQSKPDIVTPDYCCDYFVPDGTEEF
jgi:hypothetical protein